MTDEDMIATPVSWLSPQRPVEGTVFVKPAAEPAPGPPDSSASTESTR